MQTLCAGEIDESYSIPRTRVSVLLFLPRGTENPRACHIREWRSEIWLEPEIELAKNFRYSRKQIKEIETLIEEHYSELISAWREHFGS